jgi:hypothetical protein
MKQKLIKRPDGDYEWVDASKARKAPPLAVEKPVEGYELGCIQSQVETFRADAKLRGFGDVEFVPDPDVEGWYDFRAPNQRVQAKYAKEYGYHDTNGKNSGVAISADELSAAEEFVRRRYPKE